MIVDIVVAAVVLLSAIISFLRGFIREVLTILGVVGGLVASLFCGPLLAPVFRGWLGVDAEGKAQEKLFDMIPMVIVADVAAYGTVFIVVVIVLSIMSHIIAGAAKAVGLGPVDRTLGVIFGIARAAVLLGLLYLPFHLLMDQETKDEVFAGSRTHIFVEQSSDLIAGFFPESAKIEETAEEVKDEAQEQIRKRLQDQDLLKKDDETPESVPPENVPDRPAPPVPEKGQGYQDGQREKMDQLFEQPTSNE